MIAKVEDVESGNEKLCNICNDNKHGCFATMNGTSVCEKCSIELYTKLSLFISQRSKGDGQCGQWEFFQ